MYQIKIDGQEVGKPMETVEAIKWRKVLRGQFPQSLIIWVKVN